MDITLKRRKSYRRNAIETIKVELERQSRETARRVSKAIRDGLEMILERAKQYCPVDLEYKDDVVLMESGRVEMAANAYSGRIIFGNDEVFYAVYVHEMVGVVFQKAGAIPKYLETAVEELEKKMTRMVIKAIKGK